jgi:chromosome segregation ATPase
MEKMLALFDEYIVKAITTTEMILEDHFKEDAKLDHFTENRERLFAIIAQISDQIEWVTVNADTREDFNRKIEYIKKLDEKLLVKLQEHKEEVRQEIEKTYRQKENIKGYNLTDVK